MKYYSKSPQDIRKGQKRDKEGWSKRKISGVIILADIVVIVLIFTYFGQIRKQPFASRAEEIQKNFDISGVKIESSCQKKIGCHLRLQYSSLQNSPLTSIQWSVFDKNTSSVPIHVMTTRLKSRPSKNLNSGNDDNKEDTEHFFFNLSSGHVVFVHLSDEFSEGSNSEKTSAFSSKENRLQIFP